MMSKLLLPVAFIAIGLILFLPIQALTNSDGAPANRAGAPPNENTCALSGCHDSFELNSGAGTLSITIPDQFEAGDTVSITVRIEQAGASRFGFQATARSASESTQPAGTWLADNSTKFADALKEYITHNGAKEVDDAAEWTIRWVAPDSDPEDVVIYAASVAGNDNNNRSGDRVYSASAMLPVQTSIESNHDPLPQGSFELDNAYPNPFRHTTRVSYTLPHAEPVQVALYDALGRLVKTVDDGFKPAGVHEVLISGEDLPAGTYYYQINTPSNSKTHTLTRVR